jgi:prevent-host-death family protein
VVKGIMTTLPSDKARANWRDVLDSAGRGEDIVVERYGKPTVAIIAYDDYLAIQEELADMRDAREAQQVLDEWRGDAASARPWTDIRAELLAGE